MLDSSAKSASFWNNPSPVLPILGVFLIWHPILVLEPLLMSSWYKSKGGHPQFDVGYLRSRTESFPEKDAYIFSLHSPTSHQPTFIVFAWPWPIYKLWRFSSFRPTSFSVAIRYKVLKPWRPFRGDWGKLSHGKVVIWSAVHPSN